MHMRTQRWFQLVTVLTMAAVSAVLLLAADAASPAASVEGVVVDANGPVAGATVRQQTTTNATTSAADGSFALAGLPEGITVTVTAWAESYWPSGVQVVPSQSGVTLTLIHHPAGDNPDYPWLTSMPDPDNAIGCGHCMVAFPEWVGNAHGQSGVNPRFSSLYNGTDLSGTLHMGGGYKDDFPGTAGNCATCHAPGAATDDKPFTADMNELAGVEMEGVFCDFCHKVAGVYLDPATGLPYPNMPGVQSMQLNRPPAGTHMFYGPFDDVTRRVSYLELEKESQFCAPCHQFSFWGTPIYESFREWLESPYPSMGIECQTCHMKPTGVDYFVFPEKGGVIRDPQLIASHLQPGASDVELLQNTVEMTVSGQQVADRLQVTVAITNTEAGHHVPTDFPGRHMVLVVTAAGGQGAGQGAGQGQALPLQNGPVVPEWGGEHAGQPGEAYAKVLKDVVTGESPVVSYWKQTLIESDNRLPAFGSDVTVYDFLIPEEGGQINVEVWLLFRRAFQSLVDERGWDLGEVVMETGQLTLGVSPLERIYLPSLIR